VVQYGFGVCEALGEEFGEMLWRGGFEALFTAPGLPPPLGQVGHGLQQRSHGVELRVAVACDGLEGGALVGVRDAACAGDPGDADAVAIKPVTSTCATAPSPAVTPVRVAATSRSMNATTAATAS